MSEETNTPQLDLTRLLNGKLTCLEFSLEWENDGELFYGIKPTGKIAVSGVMTVKHGYMELKLNIEFPYETECFRCLKKLERKAELSAVRNVVTPDSPDADNDDYLLAEGNYLDLSEAVSDIMYLELPSRELCREDCAGLCSQCGADLNEGPCGCKKEIDPRMEIFRKYLSENEND